MQACIDSLAGCLAALEERVAGLEQSLAARPPEPGAAGPVAEPVEVPGPPAAAGGRSVVRVLSPIGIALLVLAGAFLLRSFTDAGTLTHGAGAALGLAYAVAGILAAGRAAGRGSAWSAACLGVAAVLIAYPLLWEATTKLDVLSPALAATLLTLFTALALGVAWCRGIYALAWAATLATLAGAGALLFATTALEAFTVPLLALGIATAWMAYGPEWRSLRWPAAIFADLSVALMVYLLTRAAGRAGRFDHLSVAFVQILAVSLLSGYVGSFALHSLARRRGPSAFELVQTAAVLFVGFGGAARIAESAGAGSAALGIAALVAAAASYAVAFAFVDRRLGRGRIFLYYAWLALALTLLGSELVIPAAALLPVWMVLAAGSAYLGGRYDRITLRAHCAVLAYAAAVQTGVLHQGLASFTAAAAPPWSGSLVAVLLAIAACYAVLVATQSRRRSRWMERLPRFAILLLAVAGLGGLLVRLACSLLPEGPGPIAVVRSAVIGAAAIGLAAAGRRHWLKEMSWLPYPLLVAGGIKLLAEDLRHGRPVALFIAFTCYGLALIAAPRLHRRAAEIR
ncbi:MAG: hypothetical protein AB1726_01545 [Planctomycetota bacterium]